MTLTIPTDNLDHVREDIWARLTRGGADRRSAFHTPVVASIDKAGCPVQRVMVLRKFDQPHAVLRFHTDTRSAKASQLDRPVSVIGYDPAAKVQIRLSGMATLHLSDHIADDAWAGSVASSRRCYLANPGPGTVSPHPTSGLAAELENRVPDLDETQAGRDNFAVLLVAATQFEWLYLAHTGHRRARFSRTEGGWRGEWLVP